MSYKQNNPLSRKSSPLNEGGYCAKSAGKSGCVKKEGDSWRVISNKTGKLWDAHYSSKADAEAGLRAYHGGFSRKSSERELKDMPIVDIEKGDAKGDYSGWSPGEFDPYGDTDPFVTQSEWSPGEFDPYGDTNPFDERSGKKMGPRRESSSPLNNTGITGLNYSKELKYMPIEDDMHRGMSRKSPLKGGEFKGDQSKTRSDYRNFKDTDPGYHGHDGESHGDQSASRKDYSGRKVVDVKKIISNPR